MISAVIFEEMYQNGCKAALDSQESNHDGLEKEEGSDDLLIHLYPHLFTKRSLKLKTSTCQLILSQRSS